jgi:hypothetical protein
LKSKLILEEVNELRADESSQKNRDSFQRHFGNVLDSKGKLDEKKIQEKLTTDNFNFHFMSDPLNGPVLLIYAC